MITMSILQYILCDILLVCGGIQLGMLIVKIINAQEKKQKKKGEKMPTEEKHEIKMMYALYEDGMREPIVIDEIKDLTLEEAVPILEEYNFVKVVRCKDCVHAKMRNYAPTQCPYECTLAMNYHDGNHFCSFGERGEE